jgi:hypothetical protein
MFIRINKARLKFGFLHTPRVDDDPVKKPRYTAWLVLDPKTQQDQINDIKSKLSKFLQDNFDDGIKFNHLDQLCWHKGDDKSHKYPELKGLVYISASNHKQPTIVDRGRNPLTQSTGLPYDGCYVNAGIELWKQDNKNGIGINASLAGVQFDSDGEAFVGGGRIMAAGEFDVLEDNADPFGDDSPVQSSDQDNVFDL